MALVGLACPACDKQGKVDVHMSSTPTGVVCPNGHAYRDTEELMELKPKRLIIPQRTTIQQNRCIMNLEIHTGLRDALQAKYGLRVGPTCAAILSILVEDGAFAIDGSTATELNDIFGVMVKPNSLLGLIRTMKAEHDEAVADVVRLKARLNGKDDQQARLEGVMIPNSPLLSRIEEKAAFREMTPSALITETMQIALDNSWV